MVNTVICVSASRITQMIDFFMKFGEHIEIWSWEEIWLPLTIVGVYRLYLLLLT